MKKLFTLILLLFICTAGMSQHLSGKGNTGKGLDIQTSMPSLLSYRVQDVSCNQEIFGSGIEVKSPVAVNRPAGIKIKDKINAPVEISSPIPNPRNPLAPVQGGDVIASPTVISSLPYNNTGTTAGFVNDYDAVCPYTGSTAPDVVYSYTPTANESIDIDLLGSAYDTKLYVYENSTATLLACNDDFYSDYVSALFGVAITAGNTYYIIIDGYGAENGDYVISVDGAAVYPIPPNDDCATATPVAGPFPQTINGTNLGATVDCPGLLDWNAVWYAVTLPYAINNLTVNWCGTENMSTVGVVYYNTCPVVCANYVLYNSNIWSVCGTPAGATTANTTFLNIAGPGIIYYPAHSIPQMDHVITFNVVNAVVPCPAPTALTVTNRTTTSVDLGWTAGGTESLWNVEVGLPGFVPGTGAHVFKASLSVNTVNASPLDIGTRYEFYVQADCGTETSAWSSALGFSTLIECPAGATNEIEICGDTTNNACNNVLPVNQTSEPITLGETICGTSFYSGTNRDTDWFLFTLSAPTNVTITAKAEFDLQILFVSYPCPASVIAAGTALSGVTATLTTQLNPGTYFAWVGPQFTSVFACGTGDKYYATLTGAPITGYCIPAPTSVDGIGITNVTFSSVNNTTVAETGNYGDYSAMIGDVQRTTTVPVFITYETGFTYDTKIWIDWNDDFYFSSVDEEVYVGMSTSVNPTTLAASFFVPPTAPLGNHRMRIGGVDVGPPTPCYTGSYGTYEDYTVNVLEAPACPAPSGLAVSNILTDRVDLNWTENGTAVLWNVIYGAPGFDPLTEGTLISGVTNPYTLLGLLTNTPYTVYVQADCGSAWSTPVTFTTACLTATLPFSESFDGEIFAPACWANVKTAGTSIPGIWDRQTAGTYPVCTPHSGAGMARYNSFNLYSGTKGILVTPQLEIPSDQYVVNFWMYRDDGYLTTADLVNVYYNTNPNTTGATFLGSINRSMNLVPVVTTIGWYQYEFLMPAGTSGNAYIVFEAVSAFGNNMFIDDVSVIAYVPPISLTVTAFLEGLYDGAGGMYEAQGLAGPEFPGYADQVIVELHNDVNYATIEYASGPANLSTAGVVTVTDIPSGLTGSYYITIKHRNSIETTSAAPVSFAVGPVSYDFTTASSQAYGDNMKLMGTVYAIWGGDVNLDGLVDSGDMNPVENASTAITFGYVVEDVNGDGLVDSGDMNIVENNSINIVSVITP